MPEQNDSTYLNSSYGKHLMGCAEIAYGICERFNVRDDSARQACFATVVIDAKEHFIFASDFQKEQAEVEKSVAKANGHIKEIDPNPTEEKFAEVARGQFLEKINEARELLNKEGHDPQITPAGLNALIKKEFQVDNLGMIVDNDMLSELLKKLLDRLDVLRSFKKEAKTTVPAGAPF